LVSGLGILHEAIKHFGKNEPVTRFPRLGCDLNRLLHCRNRFRGITHAKAMLSEHPVRLWLLAGSRFQFDRPRPTGVEVPEAMARNEKQIDQQYPVGWGRYLQSNLYRPAGLRRLSCVKVGRGQLQRQRLTHLQIRDFLEDSDGLLCIANV
jgi:hypothetical protein